MARGIRVEEVRVVSRGGATLQEMMNEAERARDPGTTLFLFGVPDLWVRGHGRMDREKVRPLEETMKRARGRREWVLGPIFPPRDASQGEISTIHCINAQVTMINNGNGNATPGWHLHMYYQQGGRFCIKERNYRDRIHWSPGGERIAQNKLRLWKEIRERQGREDRRERRREREGLRERQEEVERRIAEYGRSQREECERRIEEYAREQRETLREEEERRPGRLIIRYAREQREVIREDEEQDGDLRDRLRRRR